MLAIVTSSFRRRITSATRDGGVPFLNRSTIVARLAKHGLLGPGFVGAHGVWLTDDDIRMLADAGAAVAHNPGSNLRLGCGIAPVRELLDRGKPLFLIFANPNCGPCAALFREVAEWQRTRAELLTIAIISQGNIKENFVNVARHDLRDILLQTKREVAESYGALVTPTAVIVRLDGRIGSAIAAGAEEIRALLADLVGNASVGAVNPDQQRESGVLIPRVAD